MTAVYPLLRELAQMRLRRSGGDPALSATELVNEAYLAPRARRRNRLPGPRAFPRRGRACYPQLRRRLSARTRLRKRGGGLPFVELDRADGLQAEELIDLRTDWMAVHEALNRLEEIDRDCARMVELKFFSSLTAEEDRARERCHPGDRRAQLALRQGLAARPALPAWHKGERRVTSTFSRRSHASLAIENYALDRHYALDWRFQ